MSKLEELIAELCPDGVEYKSIREIAEVGTGNSNGNESVDNGLFPFFVRSQTIKSKDDYEYDEEAIIIPGEGGIGEIFHYINGKYALHQRVYRIHFVVEDVNTKFAYYYMQAYFKPFILKKAVSATVTSIRKPMIEDFPLPVPPLPVQREIVRILDSFTELTTELVANLSAERTAIKQQYVFYREPLLNNDGKRNGHKYKLGEVCDIYLGLTATPNYTETGVKFISAQNTSSDYLDLENVKYISRADFTKATSNAKPRRGDLLFTRVGSNLGHPVVVDTDEDLCIFVSLGFLRIRDPKIVSITYLKHWMNTELFWDQVRKKVHGAAKVNLNTGWLKDFEITLPSLDIQEQITHFLDDFDVLYNGINKDLSAEVEARQKQYEYYRDKLLTFKERVD